MDHVEKWLFDRGQERPDEAERDLILSIASRWHEDGDEVRAKAGCWAPSAQLGLATTEDLFRELICRFKMEQYVPGSTETVSAFIDRALVLAEMLGGLGAPAREYRTVDGG